MPGCVLRSMDWIKASLPKAKIEANFRFQQNGNRSNVFRDGRLGGAEVQRLVLVLAVIATLLCCGSATRAQVVICPQFPPSYPRGWELMVRYQCVLYGYGPSYYQPAYYRYPTAYPYQREQVHRRPYLRPGWWW
jgi:hypothetical protein